MTMSNTHLIRNADRQDDIDQLFETVDDLMLAGSFAELDAIVASADVDALDTYMVVAWLSTTLPGAAQLPARPGLVKRCQARLEELAPDRVESLMRGLEQPSEAAHDACCDGVLVTSQFDKLRGGKRFKNW